MTTSVNHQADPATGFISHIRALLPRPSARNSYFGAVTVAGLLLFFTQAPLLGGNPLILAALIATELALSTMPVRIYGTTTVYVSYVVTLVIIAQFGPPGVVILGVQKADVEQQGAVAAVFAWQAANWPEKLPRKPVAPARSAPVADPAGVRPCRVAWDGGRPLPPLPPPIRRTRRHRRRTARPRRCAWRRRRRAESPTGRRRTPSSVADRDAAAVPVRVGHRDLRRGCCPQCHWIS